MKLITKLGVNIMERLQRVKLQSIKDPNKFKYITTSYVKVGETLCFKWHSCWIVVKILKLLWKVG